MFNGITVVRASSYSYSCMLNVLHLVYSLYSYRKYHALHAATEVLLPQRTIAHASLALVSVYKFSFQLNLQQSYDIYLLVTSIINKHDKGSEISSKPSNVMKFLYIYMWKRMQNVYKNFTVNRNCLLGFIHINNVHVTFFTSSLCF